MKLLHLLLAVVVVQSGVMMLMLFEPSAVQAEDEKKPEKLLDSPPQQSVPAQSAGQLDNFAAITVTQTDGSDALVVFSKAKNHLEKNDNDKPFEYITSMAVYSVNIKANQKPLELLATRYLEYDLAIPGFSVAAAKVAKEEVEAAKKSYHEAWGLNKK